ncbi:oligosaccharide repeat unit polymerase [Cupriavidus sp. 30B13]|uniref:oligosaccharide repeat unit polymerase n=1 Tax=Cupriavidus sp. 30B13 TaxID=3384241 RepID=UPI003B919E02
MKILKSFLVAWCFYWLLQLILPVRPMGEAVLLGFVIQLIFVLAVTLGYLAVERWPDASADMPGWTIDRRLVLIALILSAFGTAALAYDKIVVQGIDYSAGLAVAREQWRELGAEREGAISSPASALGYLLSSCYIAAIVLFPYANLGRRVIVYGVSAAFLAFANTVLTGGRSTLILTLLFYIATRILMGRRNRAGGPAMSRRSRWLTLGLVSISGLYFVFIFLQRADAAGVSVTDYSYGVLQDLGLFPSTWLEDMDPRSMLTSLLNLSVMSISYFSHSFATTVAIADYGYENNFATVVFITALGLAAKLHIIQTPNTDWFLAGAFPSLPGAFYLQGGWGMLILTGAILGVLTALSKCWYRSAPSILSLGCLTALMCVLLASPILFVADVMMFPFVMFQFGLIYLIARFIK